MEGCSKTTKTLDMNIEALFEEDSRILHCGIVCVSATLLAQSLGIFEKRLVSSMLCLQSTILKPLLCSSNWADAAAYEYSQLLIN